MGCEGDSLGIITCLIGSVLTAVTNEGVEQSGYEAEADTAKDGEDHEQWEALHTDEVDHDTHRIHEDECCDEDAELIDLLLQRRYQEGTCDRRCQQCKRHHGAEGLIAEAISCDEE